MPNDRPETFIRAIEKNVRPQMDLVCCILTNNRKDRYDAIKKVLCVDYPVPSQVWIFSEKKIFINISILGTSIKNTTKIRTVDVSCN